MEDEGTDMVFSVGSYEGFIYGRIYGYKMFVKIGWWFSFEGSKVGKHTGSELEV